MYFVDSFCPDCGKDIEKRQYLSLVRTIGKLVSSFPDTGAGVAKCDYCGCRITYYNDGDIMVWHNGGRQDDVPKGTLLVSRGTEL